MLGIGIGPRKLRAVLGQIGIDGLKGNPPGTMNMIAYNTSKGGLVNFTRALAGEWGAHGITVNAVCPGFFPSKMTKATLDTAGEFVKELTPTGRLGGEEDLKGIVVLLASDASRHITGQAIAVDGGSGRAISY